MNKKCQGWDFQLKYMNKKCQGWDFQLKYMIKKHQGIIQKVLLSDIVNPAFAAFVQYYEWTFQLKYSVKE